MIKISHIMATNLPVIDGKILNISDLPKQKMVFLNIEATIGYEGVVGEDTFVCAVITGISKKRYAELHGEIPYEGRSFFFDEFDPSTMIDKIEREIVKCDRGNWDDTLNALRKKFLWEFEDYTKTVGNGRLN